MNLSDNQLCLNPILLNECIKKKRGKNAPPYPLRDRTVLLHLFGEHPLDPESLQGRHSYCFFST